MSDQARILPISSHIGYKQPHEIPLMSGGGDGGGPVDLDTQNYIDAKTEATRAQNDARFAEVMSKLESIDRTTAKSWTIYASAGALFLGALAVWAIMGDRFDGGVQVASVTSDQAARTEILAKNNAESIAELTKNTNAILRVIELKSDAEEDTQESD